MRLSQRFAPDYSIIWHGAGARCAINLEEFSLPIEEEETLAILKDRGFLPVDIDLIEIARSCLGTASYKRGALPEEAPGTLDCSTLIWWVYQQRGVELPRYSISQRQAIVDSKICKPEDLAEALPGDVIFIRGRHPYYLIDPEDGVGHVGIMTGEETVIHAANTRRGVVEDPISVFLQDWTDFRGIGRVIPPDRNVITLLVPHGRSIRWSIDLHRMILQRLT